MPVDLVYLIMYLKHMPTTSITRPAAGLLFDLANDVLNESRRPIDRKENLATLSGAARALYAIGIGMTPDHLKIAAFDAVRTLGPRPVLTADNQARKDWKQNGVDLIIAEVDR